MSIGDKIKKEITGIEYRTDMTDEQKVSRISHIACATCAGIAIQPIAVPQKAKFLLRDLSSVAVGNDCETNLIV